MGLCHARLKLVNAQKPDLAAIELDALADAGADLLCVPQHVAVQLQLDELEKREVVHPKSREVIPNPANPTIAGALAMGVRHARSPRDGF